MNFQKRSPTPKSSPIMTQLQSNIFPHNITSSSHSIIVGSAATFVWQHFVSQRCEIDFSNCTTYVWQHLKLFRSARTSYRASVRPPVPSRPPATIFPEFIDELKHCRQASGTPQIVYFLKAHDVSYPNSDKNSNTATNTKTNTETNTKRETNKGRS